MWLQNRYLKLLRPKEVNKSGHTTQRRKVQPEEWYKLYKENIAPGNREKPAKNVLPPNMFSLPGIEMQFVIFAIRNFLSKISNSQYLIISLLEAPILAFVLGYLQNTFMKENIFLLRM
jgi:ABC transport system ATP-binding/permease protein